MLISRMLSQRLRAMFEHFPALAVTGARQVGKSTWLRECFGAGAETVVFDPIIDVENARREPDLFLAHKKTPLILDEVQYVPEVVAALKRKIDRDRSPGQYLLTGSQQWGVLRSMAESLAGRTAFLDLEGFALTEIAQVVGRPTWIERWLTSPDDVVEHPPKRLKLPFSPYEQIWRGFLPEALFLPADLIPDFHASYLRTYVERDVRIMAAVEDWQAFGRFVKLAAALSAQEVNMSKFGREIGITPQTARRWLAVLNATFQWFEIPAFSMNTSKRVSAKPKGYIADTGFACFAQAISTPSAMASHPSFGALFETAVAAEIRKLCGLLSPRPNVYHWRSHGGAEVDLLLERDGTIYPIEVKATAYPKSIDTRGITAFRSTYPQLRVARGLVLAPCEKMIVLNETDVALPFDAAGDSTSTHA